MYAAEFWTGWKTAPSKFHLNIAVNSTIGSKSFSLPRKSAETKLRLIDQLLAHPLHIEDFRPLTRQGPDFNAD